MHAICKPASERAEGREMDNRADIEQRIKQLRQRASHYRQAAHHADSRTGYNEDMLASARCENEADELEASIYDRRAQR